MLLRKFILWLLLLGFIAPTALRAQGIDDRIAGMSLEEKVGQMMVISFYGTELPADVAHLLQTWQPGGVVLLPSNLVDPEQITTLTNSIQQTLVDAGTIPAFIMVDQEGGVISRLQDGFTQWPVPMLLTATQNPDLAYRFGGSIAEELRAVGINMNLAPVADLLTNPDNPIIGRRSFGTEAQLVAPMVAEVVEGLQAGEVLATVKHFPGHGDTSTDSHVELPIVPYQWEQLLSREIIPFQQAINADVGAVMIGHLALPAIEPDETLPASLSPRVVTDLLRGELGYEGIIITDALDMDAIDLTFGSSEAARLAVLAGNDFILLGAHVGIQQQLAAMQTIVDSVRAGEISEAQIDASVRRILLAKERFRLTEWQPLLPVLAEERIHAEEHQALITTLFEEGITLVRDGNALIPLQGTGLMIYPATRPSLWEDCQVEGYRGMGISLYPTEGEIAAAVSDASRAATVVLFTQNLQDNDPLRRLAQQLPENRTVVVALWSYDDLYFLPAVSTYLATYSPLRQGQAPLCAILRGERPAQGILSAAIPYP
ncbi:MAG: glycoside hydrolase family 3 protein [Anaerolineae bacterium]|nr:glycoside hydrolase family 3 protein [Anaerolineae bacterium]